MSVDVWVLEHKERPPEAVCEWLAGTEDEVSEVHAHYTHDSGASVIFDLVALKKEDCLRDAPAEVKEWVEEQIKAGRTLVAAVF